MTDRRPKVKDRIFYMLEEYTIQAIAAEEDSYVLTRLGDPGSKAFVLVAAELRWQESLHAWWPMGVRNFFEAD